MTRSTATLNHSIDCICAGMTVDVRYLDDDEVITITIGRERDATQNVISTDSPMGRALLGARIGETRRMTVGEHAYAIQVLRMISPALSRAD